MSNQNLNLNKQTKNVKAWRVHASRQENIFNQKIQNSEFNKFRNPELRFRILQTHAKP